MPLHAARLRSALAAAPSVDPFDPWIRVDKRDYRLAQRRDELVRTVDRLRLMDEDRRARIEGVRRMRELPAIASAAQVGDPQPLFRVPLLVEDREGAGALLEAAGHPFHYVYDPPLDDYAGGEFVEPSPAREAARWWARHVLPVDPLLAEPALAALAGGGAATRPATPPSDLSAAAPP